MDKTVKPEIGIKDTKDKLSLQEIYPEFIKQMALRMNSNKGKYPPFNWMEMPKGDAPLLIDALERHILEVKNLITYHSYEDDSLFGDENSNESVHEHIAAIGCDAMMLLYILNK